MRYRRLGLLAAIGAMIPGAFGAAVGSAAADTDAAGINVVAVAAGTPCAASVWSDGSEIDYTVPDGASSCEIAASTLPQTSLMFSSPVTVDAPITVPGGAYFMDDAVLAADVTSSEVQEYFGGVVVDGAVTVSAGREVYFYGGVSGPSARLTVDGTTFFSGSIGTASSPLVSLTANAPSGRIRPAAADGLHLRWPDLLGLDLRFSCGGPSARRYLGPGRDARQRRSDRDHRDRGRRARRCGGQLECRRGRPRPDLRRAC